MEIICCLIFLLSPQQHSMNMMYRAWILYSWGRVWVHHLSFAKGHCWFSLLQWLTQCFFVCLYMQMNGRKKSHYWNGDRWWWPLLITILAVATTADCLSSGEPEFKLGWWTQTLPRLEKKHYRALSNTMGWRMQRRISHLKIIAAPLGQG